MDHVFDVVSKKSLPYPQSSRFSYMFASSSFIVLCFIFRSMIHFEFILFLFACECPVISAPFVVKDRLICLYESTSGFSVLLH